MLGIKANRWSRREFLSVGSLGSLALPQLLQAESAVREAGGLAKDKCVVFLFQHGGPSQYETFDPKMSAPAGIRSVTGEIPTSIPGITFGSTMERLATMAHKFSIVRSFTTESNAHALRHPHCQPASAVAAVAVPSLPPHAQQLRLHR